MSLFLDHISVQTPSVDATVDLLRDRLGLNTTRTPAAPDRHGRVYLDRGYLEVAVGAEAALALFFLRFEHLHDTLRALARRRLGARVGSYEGRDGTWQEIEIDAGTVAPLPFLIRRMTPPEVAKDWPPPLAAPHPCGAETLAAVHLRVPRLEPALNIYERLLDSPAKEIGAGRAVFGLSSGRIVLQEAADSAPAVAGLELCVAALESTWRHLSATGIKAWRAEDALWVDVSTNWRLGFRETATGGTSPARKRP